MTAPVQLDLSFDRDEFLQMLLRDLAGALEDVVGVEEASGFISLVGQRMGARIVGIYCTALNVPALSEELLPAVLVDMKRRIKAQFSLLEHTTEKMVFRNGNCPFGDHVIDRPSLCMMTSNVFGVITAGVTGYAKVVLEKTIAGGEGECRVVVFKRKSQESDAADGREYFHG